MSLYIINYMEPECLKLDLKPNIIIIIIICMSYNF